MAPEVKIRDLSPEVYARLQESARANGRSMEAELRRIVAEAVDSPTPRSQQRASTPSLVVELREHALDPAIPITDLLRKVKVVAAKLGVNDILEWVTRELAGYPDYDSVIPDYREIRGVAKGWNPVQGRWLKIQFPNQEFEERVSTQKSLQPISEIEQYAEVEDGSLAFTASSALAMGLRYATEARLFVSRSQIVRILDAVRNRVLDWALALEEQGITGEGISFSRDEKVQATTSDFHFTTYHVHAPVAVLGDVSDGSVIQNVNAPMEALAKELHALSELAANLNDPRGIVVTAAADRAAAAATAPQPDTTLIERLIGGMSSLVQGIAALGPAWVAVTTEAAKMGLKIGLPGS